MFSERKIIPERSQPSEEPECLTLEQIVSTTFDGVTGRQAGTGSESHIFDMEKSPKGGRRRKVNTEMSPKQKTRRKDETLMHHDV
jgi:hypothetical protein